MEKEVLVVEIARNQKPYNKIKGQVNNYMQYLKSVFDSSLRVRIHNHLCNSNAMDGRSVDLCRGYNLIQNEAINVETQRWKQEFLDSQCGSLGFIEMMESLKFMGWIKENNRCKEKCIQLVAPLEQQYINLW
eukprot:TRINITY_DN15931_c0_g1_i3.p1 TRINITY_DN15931_c0_g1~~TRINITY_DN15931_c0_g1_i3.p1  ORF type:complete len:132 (-),score=7.93 TRINITY_DN15931_c0_g1_i3:102-497(-)